MENNRRERKRRTSRVKEASEQAQIEYTRPKPFVKKRLIVQLLTVTAIVLAIAVGTSVFFKIDTVTVAGAEKYTAYSVAQASGIEIGDHLLFFGQAEAAARIKAQLPYVGTVRFSVKLPGTVTIIIEEKTVAYAIKATDGTYWNITSDGIVAEKLTDGARSAPVIDGVVLADPAVGEAAVADETQQEGTATGAERLAAAKDILRQVETWELFSDVTRIDVSDLYAMHLYCGEKYRIELGGREELNEQFEMIKSVLCNENIADSGVFTLFYADGKWQMKYNPWT